MNDFDLAIAQAERLRIIGLLTLKPGTPEKISETLGFHPADTGSHLETLIKDGLVRFDDGLYELEETALTKLNQPQFENELQSRPIEPREEDERQQVLKAYLNPDGTLKNLPAQAAKLQMILEFLIYCFRYGSNYTEKEVNTILIYFHPDTAALRRYLVEAGLLRRERDGSRYWRQG
jgi:hypothetical protein